MSKLSVEPKQSRKNLTEDVPVSDQNDNFEIEIHMEDWSHRLSYFKRALDRSLLSTDIELLNRLMYKNKNQQKSSLHYRKLCLVKRLLKRLDALSLDSMLQETLDAMFDMKYSKKVNMNQWTHIPSTEYLFHFRSTLESATLVIDATLEALPQVFALYKHQFSDTLFMPISLTIMAISSRVYDLTKTIRDKELPGLHSLLNEMLLASGAPISDIRKLSTHDIPEISTEPRLYANVPEKIMDIKLDESMIVDAKKEKSIAEGFWKSDAIGTSNSNVDANSKSLTKPVSSGKSESPKKRAPSENKSGSVDEPKRKKIKPESNQKSKTNSKKGGADEIDDIFAGLL